MLNRVNAGIGFGFALLLMAGGCTTGPAALPDLGKTERQQLAAALLLPDCRAEEEATGALVDQLPSCRLKLRGSGAFITLTSDPVDYQPEGELGFLTLSVISRTGHMVAQFSEVTMGRYAYPRLGDFNRDGRDDLLVPVLTGRAGPAQALWLQEKTGDFVRVETLLAGDVRLHPGGLIASSRQGTEMQWETRYFRLKDARLEVAAVVTGRGSRPPKRGGVCTVEFLADGEQARSFCRR